MEQQSSRILNLCFHAVTVVSIGVMLVIGVGRALHPSLHMDESLYLGATLKMLHGDPLLTTYWLDKIPWASLLMIPGVMIAGENALGFHLSGLIAATLGVLVAQRLLWEMLGRSFWSVCAMLFYLFINISQFMVFHHASAFTDPFLLLFLLLSLRSLWLSVAHHNLMLKDRYEHRAYVFFTAALLAKFGAFMWAPVLVGYWILRYQDAWWRVGPRRFLHAGRYLWLLALIFMLANPGKLAPIAWFSALFAKHPASAKVGMMGVLWQRMSAWVNLGASLLGSPLIMTALLLVTVSVTVFCGVYLLRLIKSVRPRLIREWYALFTKAQPLWARWTLLLLLPFWAHAFGLCISGASLFDRYLYILVPQLVLSVIVGLHLVAHLDGGSRRWANVMSRSGLLLLSALGLMVGANGLNVAKQWSYVSKSTIPTANARLLYAVRDELPRGSVLHHHARLWFLYPFTIGTTVYPACAEDRCLAEAQIGRAPFDRQYVLVESSDHTKWDLVQTYPEPTSSTPFHTKSLVEIPARVVLRDVLSESHTRSQFRLFGWARSLEWSPQICHDCKQNFEISDFTLPLWSKAVRLPQVPATLTIRLNTGDRAWLPQFLKLSGHFTLSRGRITTRQDDDHRWFLGFRLERLSLDTLAFNLVDLAPIIYGGYLVPMGPVDIQPSVDSPFHLISHLEWNGETSDAAFKGTIQKTNKDG